MVVGDFNNLNNEKNVNTESSEYKVSDKLEINSNYVMQDDHKKEQTKKHSLDINDDDDEKQDELEISDLLFADEEDLFSSGVSKTGLTHNRWST
ncbi:uncharacterized protein OCT59_004096 [Rhizophagus irregularis]|uniref:uncharacterized protein n=1 Tax=Rhizophagus irregularis TaxID=588596 RepID=UPI0033331835|nr:hypothetical protein OCT59_004096 [Rhizophagus irregularis]